MNHPLKSDLQSFLDRLRNDSYAGTMFEGDADTLRDAIAYIDRGERIRRAASSPLLPQQGGDQTASAHISALLDLALVRMDRARRLLTNGNPSPECNWGMLDTSDLVEALAAVSPQVGEARLSDVQIDSIRNTVMIQLATENAGVIGGADVENMQFPKRFAEAIMTALGSPIPVCGICGDTGKWHAGYTGLFGGSVPVYETCKCAAKGNLYVGLANGDEWAQDTAAKFILGEAKAVAIMQQRALGAEPWVDMFPEQAPRYGASLEQFEYRTVYTYPVVKILPIAVEKDAQRYHGWRSAVIEQREEFIELVSQFLPDSDDESIPTSDEWDIAIDSAIAAMQGEKA